MSRIGGWRRLFQLRLATLLTLVTLSCCAMGIRQWYQSRYVEQQAAAKEWVELGARVETQPGEPAWLRRVMDPKVFRDVVLIHAEWGELKDDDLQSLSKFPRLKRLYLAGNYISDDGLAAIKNCTHIQRMSLWQTHIGDAGMANLARMRELESLDIHNTRVGDDGLKHLARATKLKQIQLPARVTDDGLRHLRNLKSLESVAFQESTITPRGVGYLERSPITWLSSKLTSCGEDDLLHLTKLRDLPSVDLNGLTLNPAHFSRLSKMKATTLTASSTLIDDSILPHLAKMPNLEQLQLDGTRITNEGCHEFEKFSKLVELKLTSSQLNRECLETLTSLKGVDVSEISSPWFNEVDRQSLSNSGVWRMRGFINLYARYPDEEQQPWLCGNDLENLRTRPEVSELRISSRHAHDCDLTVLSKFKQLNSLWITYRKGEPSIGREELEQLLSIPQLREIHIKGSLLPANDLLVLRTMPNLKALHVDGVLFTDEDLDRVRRGFGNDVDVKVARLHQLARIIPFALKEGTSDHELFSLRDYPSITDLRVTSSSITDDGLAHLGDLKDLSSLQIQSAKVTGSGLASLTNHAKLNVLWLQNCGLVDSSLKFLPRRSLIVDISGTRVTSAGLIHLEGMDKLHTLKLRGSRNKRLPVSGAGMATLAGLRSLKSLELSHTNVNDDDLRLLSKSKTLRELRLENTDITDEGTVHFAKMESLTRLTLADTRATKKGVERLMSLPKLKYIDIGSTLVTNMENVQLNQSKPKHLTIRWAR